VICNLKLPSAISGVFFAAVAVKGLRLPESSKNLYRKERKANLRAHV